MPGAPTPSSASATAASPDGAEKKRAIVAVGRSILVIIWHLFSDDQARFLDLGSGYYESRVNLRAAT